MKKRFKTYLWLFGINLFISAFTFGGGYVVISMIRKYFVEKNQLLQEEELSEMAAIAQSSPGAIAINLSVLVGYKIAKLPGAIISCMAAILPPLFIISIISASYTIIRNQPIIRAALKGMEAVVCALIADIVIDMTRAITKKKEPFLILLIPIAFLASSIFQIHVIIIILSCSLLCFIVCLIQTKRNALCSKN